MEILNESTDSKKTFLSHVFSTTDEGVAELTNVIQYTTMGVVPIVVFCYVFQQVFCYIYLFLILREGFHAS